QLILLIIVLMITGDFALAQINPVKNDSNRLYQHIETYSKRSKFTKFIYGLFFTPVAKPVLPKKGTKKENRTLVQEHYRAFEGKVIRQINIETLEPFGYSVNDTGVVAQNFLYKTANSLHVTTQHITIRDLMLIHRNQIFDSLLVKESERLLRSRGYITDVAFKVKESPASNDSVDIDIRVLDSWSIVPKVFVAPSRYMVGLSDQNFLGFGHAFQNEFDRNLSSGINAFTTNYDMQNIWNTYINATLHYGADGYHNLNRSVTIDRPFYSPVAQWAGGVYLATELKKDSLKVANTGYVPLNLKLDTQDYWLAKAFRLLKGNNENERTTNLILALRYLQVRYDEKPLERYDPLQVYSNEDFVLSGLGISTRRYVKDRYVYNYGINEEIPVGRVYGLTAGYQIKNNVVRPYWGVQVSFGDYNSWGYLSSDFEFGTFVHASKTEQGVLSIGVNYFTRLFEIGQWKFRQFVKPQLTLGINRFYNDSLTLKDGYGLNGFNSSSLSGTKRLLFSVQTQSYAPWNLLGFRFGPYLIYSLGMLGDGSKGFRNSKVYSQIGLGVLIKNENMVINTFQISISFYPSIPGSGNDIFKFNSYNTSDFGLRDFEFGKPAAISFQ
ncbi:MAG: hypothetical protein Q8908_07540, partial [Bacteroidota bacterium]|nr:hypothetical protein [Bacteroidota bacterium]